MNFEIIIWILVIFGGFIAGWLTSSFLGENGFKNAKKKSEQLLRDAKSEAENTKQELMLEAQEELFQQKQKLEDEFKAKRSSLNKLENDLSVKDNNLDRKADLIAKKDKEIILQEREIRNRENQVKIRQQKLDALMDEANQKLEDISGLTREEAKKILMDNLIEDAKKEAASTIYNIAEEANREATAKAKNIIISSIQQTASDHAIESTVSVVTLPSDDMKGRIIGREGRNIRAFEIVTGVDVIVDDTPEAVILSGYDPYRRELARITMEKLISDGRIHPGRIEETYDKTVQEMDEYFAELGEQALLETGVHGVHPDVAKLLGKLRFRTSYGQNVLQHCKEVAIISGIMAAELGLETALAKRAGILHDIGRASDRHTDGDHAQIGYEIVKKNGEHPVVLNAILAHHGGAEPISPIAILVQAANEMSSARPGARREVIENYVNRMKAMEGIAESFEGVKTAYAIQAGKEVRIIIDHDKVDDAASFQLASEISRKIQSEIDYPGQIKVVVIREFRAVDYA